VTDETREYAASLLAYPNLRRAAEILGVASSTLSRRDDVDSERRGERDRALPAAEVLRLGTIYRKRSLNDVAQDLVELARREAPDDAARVEEEVESFFGARALTEKRRESFLETARRLLPPGLYKAVAETVSNTEDAPLPDALMGDMPLPRR